MSSHTRMMLDKLKQSTSELQGLTDGAEEPVFSPRKPGAERRKKSRFLRPEAEEEVQQEINSYIFEFETCEQEEPDRERTQYASSLANEVLGLRNDSMGDYDRYRPEPAQRSPPRRPARLDWDDEPAPQPRRSVYISSPSGILHEPFRVVDDDDTDAMIANLKKTTTRRAATDILRDIESDTTADRVKFEPVAVTAFRPSPEPEPNRYFTNTKLILIKDNN